MAEVTEKEYRAKENEKSKYETQRKNCETAIQSLDDKIYDLDKAIDTMTQIYDDFKSNVTGLERLLEQKRDFSGVNKTKLIDSDGKFALTQGKDCQDNVVNYALDQLEWLRTDLKNQRDAQYGNLSIISNAIRSISTWLKTNFFNN